MGGKDSYLKGMGDAERQIQSTKRSYFDVWRLIHNTFLNIPIAIETTVRIT